MLEDRTGVDYHFLHKTFLGLISVVFVCPQVVSKSARDTHCHFCFEILPADPVPCSACSIPLYCSELCRNTAKGCSASHDSKYSHANGKLSRECLELGNPSASPSTQLPQSGNCQLQSEGNSKCPFPRLGEHIPECGGASWSAVLPTEAVLGARMLFRTICTDEHLQTRKLNVIGGSEESEVSAGHLLEKKKNKRSEPDLSL